MRFGKNISSILKNTQNLNRFSMISRARYCSKKYNYEFKSRKPEEVYEYAKEYFSYFNEAKDTKKMKPIVFCGPSGVGKVKLFLTYNKGTLLNRLLTTYPNYFEFSVSSTTRNPRPGEVHGKQYFFVSKDEFHKVY